MGRKNGVMAYVTRARALFGAMIVTIGLGLMAAPMSVMAANDRGIQIAPLRTRPALRPGDTAPYSFTLTNHESDTKTVTLAVQRFKTVSESYDYAFNDDPSTDWVRLPETHVAIEAGQKVTLPYSVAVPLSASPGGHYFAIFASVESSDSDHSLREIKRVASLIYLEVEGEVSKKGALAGFNLPNLTFTQTVPLSVRLANQGNTHFDVDVRLAVGGTVQENATLKGLLLPGTTRRFDGSIRLPKLPGVYNVTARYSASDTQAITTSRAVIYMPPWFVVVVTIGAAGLSVGLYKKTRRR